MLFGVSTAAVIVAPASHRKEVRPPSSPANGKALFAKLNAALADVASGDLSEAIDSLKAFINQVKALVKTGMHNRRYRAWTFHSIRRSELAEICPR
jgi:hypothetical protein